MVQYVSGDLVPALLLAGRGHGVHANPFQAQLIARIARELGIPEEAVDRRLAVAFERDPGLTSLTFDAAMRASPQTGGEHAVAMPSEEKS